MTGVVTFFWALSRVEPGQGGHRQPDPIRVAPPGQSLHRYATELDPGRPSACGWRAANAERFAFIKPLA